MNDPVRKSALAGVVLAGGDGTRMGERKEGVVLPDGRAMIEAAFDLLEPICDSLVVAGDCTGYDLRKRGQVVHLHDLHKGIGPIAGLHAVFASGVASAYLIVACDQPMITTDLLQKLVEDGDNRARVFVSESDARIFPFPGFYPAECRSVVEKAISTGDYSVRRIIDQSDAERIPLTGAEIELIQSINTKDELNNCRKRFQTGAHEC